MVAVRPVYLLWPLELVRSVLHMLDNVLLVGPICVWCSCVTGGANLRLCSCVTGGANLNRTPPAAGDPIAWRVARRS
jgi:hypothetical protein